MINQPRCLNHHFTLLTPSPFLAIPLFSTIILVPNILNLSLPSLSMVVKRDGDYKGAIMVKIEWFASVKIWDFLSFF